MAIHLNPAIQAPSFCQRGKRIATLAIRYFPVVSPIFWGIKLVFQKREVQRIQNEVWHLRIGKQNELSVITDYRAFEEQRKPLLSPDLIAKEEMLEVAREAEDIYQERFAIGFWATMFPWMTGSLIGILVTDV